MEVTRLKQAMAAPDIYLARKLDSQDHMRIQLAKLQAVRLYVHQGWWEAIGVL